MNTLRCQGIAQRLNRLLLRRFGLGLDPQRLLADALYRRDVLLVCDAHPGTDLASLAQHFRLAQAAPDPALGPPSRGVEESPGLARSRPRSSANAPAEGPLARPAAPGWLSSSFWLGGR